MRMEAIHEEPHLPNLSDLSVNVQGATRLTQKVMAENANMG